MVRSQAMVMDKIQDKLPIFSSPDYIHMPKLEFSLAHNLHYMMVYNIFLIDDRISYGHALVERIPGTCSGSLER